VNFIQRLLKHFKNHKLSILPFIILGLWILLALLPLFIPSLKEVSSSLEHRLLSPCEEYWLGTDSLGRSVSLLILNGAKTSFMVSIATVFLSIIIGIPLGAVCGYYGGKIDFFITKIIDILLAFPPLILPLTILVFLGSGYGNIILILAITGWMSYARLMRGQFASFKERELVLASKVLGASDTRIIFKHILPNVFTPLIIQATSALEGVIIAEAGLSFLGLGVGASFVSWGNLLNDGQNYLMTHPYLVFFPALSLLSIVYCLNQIGEVVRIINSPKS
jgi:peptide/nickel transport system permease protein